MLLDINLPGITGTDGVRLLQSKHPRCANPDADGCSNDQDRIFESICNGACGYLLKKTPLHKAARSDRRGARRWRADVAGDRAQGGADLPPGRAPPSDQQGARFTDQQVRNRRLLAAGHSYQSSAQQLGITINTVRNHVRDIYDALHVHSKVGGGEPGDQAGAHLGGWGCGGLGNAAHADFLLKRLRRAFRGRRLYARVDEFRRSQRAHRFDGESGSSASGSSSTEKNRRAPRSWSQGSR